MNVRQLREMLDTLDDDTWVFVRSRGQLADPFIDLEIDPFGDAVLVIA